MTMSLARRIKKLEGMLPQSQELPPVPEDLRAALRKIGLLRQATGGRIRPPKEISPDLKEALGALSTGLLKQRFTE
jgi:hypothetical protein